MKIGLKESIIEPSDLFPFHPKIALPFPEESIESGHWLLSIEPSCASSVYIKLPL